MASESSTLTIPRFNLPLRVKASISAAGMRGGKQTLYLRLRWWIVLWRLLWLATLPLFLLLAPDYFDSIGSVIFLAAVALIYIGLYAVLSVRFGYAARHRLFVLDLIVCSALLVLSKDPHLLLIFAVFSIGLLFPGAILKPWQAFLIVAYLCLTFVASQMLHGAPLQQVLAHSTPIFPVCTFICWGTLSTIYFFLIDRLYSPDIEKHLAEQRQEYRRRLHDDLGNTLCGLHFRIRGLTAVGEDELAESCQVLNQGYNRACDVLGHLVSGLEEEIISEDINDSLIVLKEELEQDFSGRVTVSAPRPLKLSPEIQRQVLSIIREAASNSFKHAGVGSVVVSIKKKRRHLSVGIRDNGAGFDPDEPLSEAMPHDGQGLKNMSERAGLLKGDLKIDTGVAGTTVTLDMPVPRNAPTFNNLIRNNPQRDISRMIPLMKKMKMIIFFFFLIHMLMLPSAVRFSTPILVIASLFALNTLIWILMLSPVSSLLARYPRLMLTEFIFYSGVFYYALQNDVSPFFWCYIAASISINAIFVKFSDSLLMVGTLGIGIFLAYNLAPADGMLSHHGARLGDPLFLVMNYLFINISAGLAFFLIEGLASRQGKAIDQALVHEREKLSARTHRQLHGLVEDLGNEISLLPERLKAGSISLKTYDQLVKQSGNLKCSLRKIMVDLEASDTPGTANTAESVEIPANAG